MMSLKKWLDNEKKYGEKKRFFNLGFNNRWQKILPKNILIQKF